MTGTAKHSLAGDHLNALDQTALQILVCGAALRPRGFFWILDFLSH
jgi:hypothetical protein